jgi:uncharacterized membrane protein
MEIKEDIEDFMGRGIFALVFLVAIGIGMMTLLLSISSSTAEGSSGSTAMLILIAPVAFGIAAFLWVYKHYAA